MKNEKVVESWIRNEHGHSLNLSTDGKNLFSYSLKIGFTGPDDVKTVYDFTRSGRFISMTTSRHVGMAKREYGALVVAPSSPKYDKNGWAI